MKTSDLETLRAFRQSVYGLFGRRRDALFEVLDALLTLGPVASPAHLSLAPGFQRGWGSLYDALAVGQVETAAIEDLLAAHPLTAGEPIYAIDASTWARCDAEASPGRAYYYHPSRHSAGQPIVAGWSYQWLAQLSFAHDSWTAPLSVRRLTPADDINTLAAQQIMALLQRLPRSEQVPIFVFDAGYDPVELALSLGTTRAAVLVRLRSGRCFYADPTQRAETGRPPRHGHKFVCTAPATWLAPTDEYTVDDPQYGTVRVRAWSNLHARPQNHARRGTRGPRPLIPGTLILVEVSRLPQPTRVPKLLWLWWHGPLPPDLARVWRAYVRRFALEHTFRFVKQTLMWTLPRLRHPEQADRWTWLVILAYTQLRLARPLVADHRLPWERPLLPGKLTPYRMQRAFSSLWGCLGTPVSVPKPCGRSPGRPKGAKSGPAPRYPAYKKSA